MHTENVIFILAINEWLIGLVNQRVLAPLCHEVVSQTKISVSQRDREEEERGREG